LRPSKASRGGSNAGDLAPGAQGSVAGAAVCGGGQAMTVELKVVVDPAVGGEEALRVTC